MTSVLFDEIQDILDDDEMTDKDKIQLIELVMDA